MLEDSIDELETQFDGYYIELTEHYHLLDKFRREKMLTG
jgi:hypothetical protein